MILIDGMIRNPLEWVIVAIFVLILCSVGGIILGGIFDLMDRILEKRFLFIGRFLDKLHKIGEGL